MDVLETIWDGQHHGCNRDLLCVDVSRPSPGESLAWLELGPPRVTTEPLRRVLLTLLAERECWQVRDLQARTGHSGPRINAVLFSLKRQGLVKGRGYGRVSLIRGEL